MILHPAPFRTGLLAAIAALIVACDSDPQEGPGPVREVEDDPVPAETANPLFGSNPTPMGAPPFHQLRAEHFLPALEARIEQAEARVAELVESQQDPTFANTIEPLAEAERAVDQVVRLWSGLVAVSGESELGDMAPEITERLSRYRRSVIFNGDLFERIEALRQAVPERPLDDEQLRLIEQTWRRFRRGGAHLDREGRERLVTIEKRLETLQHTLAEAWRKAGDDHELLIENGEEIASLPESLVRIAERQARDRGHESGYVFTLHDHSFFPFMQHFPGRDARRKLYQARMARVDADDESGSMIEQLAALRAERAALLGYDSHIDWLLAEGTVPDRATLDRLLDTLAGAAARQADAELDQLRTLAAEDNIEKLQPWDWWYYRARLAESSLGMETASLRNWFELERVREGMFSLANRLWGLSFHVRSDIPAWHLDVTAFEVRDAMGETLGLVFFDPLHRADKREGTWTSHFRIQHRRDGERIAPVVAIVANMPPAAAGTPSLLEPEQVRALFHEFGHALHSLFSDVSHAALASAHVASDFAEFPALLLEQWTLQPQLLQTYALHHESGEVIERELIEMLQRQRDSTAGLDALGLVAAIELDLALHGKGTGETASLEAAEQAVRERLDLPELLTPQLHHGALENLVAEQRYSGNFRALWSQALAADAFAAFQEQGIMNRELAQQLRETILSRGNARDPMASWQAFRGRAPDTAYLLRLLGLEDTQRRADTE